MDLCPVCGTRVQESNKCPNCGCYVQIGGFRAVCVSSGDNVDLEIHVKKEDAPRATFSVDGPEDLKTRVQFELAGTEICLAIPDATQEGESGRTTTTEESFEATEFGYRYIKTTRSSGGGNYQQNVKVSVLITLPAGVDFSINSKGSISCVVEPALGNVIVSAANSIDDTAFGSARNITLKSGNSTSAEIRSADKIAAEAGNSCNLNVAFGNSLAVTAGNSAKIITGEVDDVNIVTSSSAKLQATKLLGLALNAGNSVDADVTQFNGGKCHIVANNNSVKLTIGTGSVGILYVRAGNSATIEVDAQVASGQVTAANKLSGHVLGSVSACASNVKKFGCI